MNTSAIDILFFSKGYILSAEDLGTDEEFSQWQTVRTRMLVWAFHERPALIITESPLPSSWARWAAGQSHFNISELEHNSTTLLVLNVPTCSRELLEDAGSDEEFTRGLLWFSYPTNDSAELQACTILHTRATANTDEKKICSTEYEVLSCEADGRMLVWCSPNRDESALDQWISETNRSTSLQLQKRSRDNYYY